ncbi:type II toxin-antitoxin system MqsA family antitoxin [Mesorhizobium sp. IMUNJ 23232]|uniref:type II toxin-antitoxin system MqsA family antitoxin n=1 Tax=Mesorhizobium sp. IMUNJ 23232 TaxID=3376064 RepID=UPI0037AFC406
MATPKPLPETMVSPDTGETLVRQVRPVTLSYKGHAVTVDMPGYYNPSNPDDAVHVGNDMHDYDEVWRELRRRVDGLPSPSTIKEIRAKLKLSQREAGELFKVGENAFDKYERGLVEPSGPTTQLMKLLSKHPELVDELRK